MIGRKPTRPYGFACLVQSRGSSIRSARLRNWITPRILYRSKAPVKESGQPANHMSRGGSLHLLANLCRPFIRATTAIAIAVFFVGRAWAASPQAKFAYVTGAGSVLQFKVGSNGLLSAIPGEPASVPAGNFPQGIVVITVGATTYLYAVNVNGGSISQYKIGADGALTALNPDVFAIGHILGSATATPDGKFVYVGMRSEDIAQLVVNGDGTLSANTPEFVTSAGSGTLCPLSDRSGKFLYVSDFGHSSVLEYKINADGTLTPNSPASIAAGGFPDLLGMTASGKFLYAPNLFDGTISQYKVGSNGTLTANSPALLTLPSGADPTQVDTNAKGKMAYVPDQDLNVVYQLKIQSNGTLKKSSTVPVNAAENVTLDGSGQFANVDDAGSLMYEYTIATGKLKPNPNSMNTISAGTNNGQIALVPGGR